MKRTGLWGWPAGKIIDRLQKRGALMDNPSSQGFVETWLIASNGKSVTVRREMLGMGHNEPASYGSKSFTYTIVELEND